MFEGECDLTYEEESQIEQPANIYSIIRTLEFIEWAYNFSHIDKETYLEQNKHNSRAIQSFSRSLQRQIQWNR